MERLRNRYLNKPLEMILHPTPPADVPVVQQKQIAAAQQPTVTEQQLTAEEWFERGRARNETDYDGQIADYTEAIRLNPIFAYAYYNRGVARIRKEEIDDAIEDFNQAININPIFVEAYNNRGVLHAKKGNLDGALADFDEAIRINPLAARAYTNRGTTRKRKGDISRAMADLDEAIRLAPMYDAYINRGSARFDLGDLQGAIADFDEAIRLDSDDTPAHANRGEVYFELRDYERALKDFRQANELAPTYEYALAGLAITQHALGNLQRAKDYWKLLVGLDHRYQDPEWTGKNLNWHQPLIEEARKLTAGL
jgi:tetratricopeptide (TPR) repeat protein